MRVLSATGLLATAALAAWGLVGCADGAPAPEATRADTAASCPATPLRVAVAGAENEGSTAADVVVLDADGGAEQVTHDGRSFAPSWAADGTLLFQKARAPLTDSGGTGAELWVRADGAPPAPVAYARNFGPEQVTLGRADLVVVGSATEPGFAPVAAPVPTTPVGEPEIVASGDDLPALPAGPPLPLWRVDTGARTVTRVATTIDPTQGVQSNPTWNATGGLAFVEIQGAFGGAPYHVFARIVRPSGDVVSVELPDVGSIRAFAWSADATRLDAVVTDFPAEGYRSGHVDVAAGRWVPGDPVDLEAWDDLTFAPDGRLFGSHADEARGAYVLQYFDADSGIVSPLRSVWSVALPPC